MSDLLFQAVAWHAEDVPAEECDGSDEDSAPGNNGQRSPEERYVIKIFGRDTDGTRVSLTVLGFTPYFCVRLPEGWGKAQLRPLQSALRELLGAKWGPELLDVTLVRSKDLWTFTNGRLFDFARLKFASLRAFRAVWNRLQRPIMVPGTPPPRSVKLQVYEANIDPFIRFMHIRNIQPCGWVSVDAGAYRKTSVLPATGSGSGRVQDVEADWRTVTGADVEGGLSAPFTVASFDIECTSSHGDFPVPVKDYRKPAQELVELVQVMLQAQKPPSELELVQRIATELRLAFGLPPPPSWPRDLAPALSKLQCKAPLNKRQEAVLDEAAEDIATVLRRMPRDGRDVAVQTLMAKFDALHLPQLHGDPVIQVGMTVHRYGASVVDRRVVLVLGGCTSVAGAEVRSYESEAQLLLGFRDLMAEIDPDVVTGYNILGFDFWYMFKRAMELGVHTQFLTIGRLHGRVSEFKEKTLSSSALGDNLLRFVDMEGRVILDVMKVVQRDHKLDSYKLDAVASHFLKSNKHDVTPKDIFRLQRGGDDDRARIAAYCVQDCELCNRLIVKLEMLANNIGMANVCLVPLTYIFMRGQGIKIFSLVLKQAKSDGFLVPVVQHSGAAAATEDGDGYEGAIVLEPKEGIYTDTPVSVFDYESLYPSSMISGNLSPDTIVRDPRYDNLPNVQYENVTYDIYKGDGEKRTKVGERTCRFAQPKDGADNNRGLLPRILQKLLRARKDTRKRMQLVLVTRDADGTQLRGWLADAGKRLAPEDGSEPVCLSETEAASAQDAHDAFQKAVLDGLQLAYKVTANSLYGQCGSRTSPIYMKDVAACTTATGRQMIQKAQQFMETNYCAQVIYGDSVAGYTPVTARWHGTVFIDTVENIAQRIGCNAWLPCQGAGREEKEAVELDGLEVWSDAGWTCAHCLIRHRLAPHKRMLRIITNTGMVDVTDDHSLLRPDATVVKPQELCVGDRLLHADLPVFEAAACSSITEEAAYCMGESGWLQAPVLCASRAVRTACWRGLCEHARVCSDSTLHIVQDNQIKAAIVFALAASLGFSTSVCSSGMGTCLTVRAGEAGAGAAGAGADTVQQVTEVTDVPNPYVYDFTTDNHHFAAGVGRIVVHNTDSIFCVFPHNGSTPFAIKERGRAAIMPSIKLAMQASEAFKSNIKFPHNLQYEKTFWPFVLLSKKRYVGNMYETDDVHYKQKSMGIVLKRRDNAPIVKRVYGGVLDVILDRQDVAASVEYLRGCLTELAEGRTPLEELVVSKALRADYSDPERIAHKVLAERMARRDPGNTPQVNDRIPYVYIQVPRDSKATRQGDRIENPDYVRANGLKPDTLHYITNQVMKPLQQLYATVVDRLPGYRRPAGHFDALYAKLLRDFKGDEKKARATLARRKENEVRELLFDPVIHRLTNLRNGNREITSFFKTAT